MENASKALLIAGAILLVIAIIGVGMAIFQQASNVVDTGGQQIETLAVQAHNSMFDAYVDKTVKGKAIKELCTKIASYNQKAEANYKVTIKLTDKGVTPNVSDLAIVDSTGLLPSTGTTHISSKINTNYNYSVNADMNATTGLITTINLTRII